MIPNAIANMRREAAFETNVISEHAIPVDSLCSFFLVQPLALQHALNIPGSSKDQDQLHHDMFICGHTALDETQVQYQLQRLRTPPSRGWRCSPIRVYSVKALSGNQVFVSIFQNQRIFASEFLPILILTYTRLRFLCLVATCSRSGLPFSSACCSLDWRPQ